MLFHPVQNERIWSHQAQAIHILHAVQGSNPGVELLIGDLVFKSIQAMLPEVDGHNYYCCLRLTPEYQRLAV